MQARGGWSWQGERGTARIALGAMHTDGAPSEHACEEPIAAAVHLRGAPTGALAPTRTMHLSADNLLDRRWSAGAGYPDPGFHAAVGLSAQW